MTSTNQLVAIGSTVAGVQVEERLSGNDVLQVWRGKRGETERMLWSLGDAATASQRVAFNESVRTLMRLGRNSELFGVLLPEALSDDVGAYSTPLISFGSVHDLPALRWKLDNRLDVLIRTCDLLRPLHNAGLTRAELSPQTILLDDEFRPWIGGTFRSLAAGIELEDPDPVYVAPEVLKGHRADKRSDIYSLGRILHFLLIGEPPPTLEKSRPTLHDLALSPAGLVRIVRRCTMALPSERYPDVDTLIADLSRYGDYDDVGVAHSEGKERNLTGMSASLLPPRFQKWSDAPPRPKKLAANEPLSKPPARKRGKKGAAAPARDYARKTRLLIAASGLLFGLAAFCLPLFLFLDDSPLAVAGATTAFGVSLTAMLLPAAPRHPRLHRWLLSLSLGVLLFAMVSPHQLAGHIGARISLSGTSPDARSQAVRRLLNSGSRDFPNENLAGTDLRRLDLSDADFSGCDFSGSNLAGANFTHSDLTDASFSGADLTGIMMVDVEFNDPRRLIGEACSQFSALPPPLGCGDDGLVFAAEALQMQNGNPPGDERAMPEESLP